MSPCRSFGLTQDMSPGLPRPGVTSWLGQPKAVLCGAACTLPASAGVARPGASLVFFLKAAWVFSSVASLKSQMGWVSGWQCQQQGGSSDLQGCHPCTWFSRKSQVQRA